MSATTKHVVRQWRERWSHLWDETDEGRGPDSAEAFSAMLDEVDELLDDNARRERAMAQLMRKP